MSEEEMAKEYSKSACAWIEDREPLDERDIQQAFLAGLKAGRPNWHKVSDGDLPKDENDVLVYSGEDWRMCVGRYSPKYKVWEAGCDTIAWCEILKFKEKE